jgi:hypothetical protein
MNRPDRERTSAARGETWSPPTSEFDDEELPTAPWDSAPPWFERQSTIPDDEPPTIPRHTRMLREVRDARPLPSVTRTLPPPLPAAAKKHATTASVSRPPPLPNAARTRAISVATSAASRELWSVDRPSRSFEVSFEPVLFARPTVSVSRLTPSAVRTIDIIEPVDRNVRTALLPRVQARRLRRRWTMRIVLALLAVAAVLLLTPGSGERSLVQARDWVRAVTTDIATRLTAGVTPTLLVPHGVASSITIGGAGHSRAVDLPWGEAIDVSPSQQDP